MSEHEYTIEVLCTNYSMKRLKSKLVEVLNGISRQSIDILDNVSPEILNEAISRYNEEKFFEIRQELEEDIQRFKTN